MDSNKKELTSVTNKLKYIIKLLNERDFSAAGVRVTALKTVVDELKENKDIDDKSWLFFDSLISLMSCLYQLGSGVRKLEDLDTDEVIGFLLQTCFPFEGICQEKYLYFFIVVSAMFNNVLIYGQRLKFASFVLQLINEAHKRLDNNPQALLLTQCNPILLNISRLSCQLTFMMQVLEESTLGHEIEQEDSALLNNMKNLHFLIKTKAEFERVVKLFKPKVSDLNMCIHKMQNMEYKSLHLDLEVQKLCVGFWRGLLAYYQTYYETDNEIKLLLREESSDLWAACKIDCLRMMNFKGNADPSLVFIYKSILQKTIKNNQLMIHILITSKRSDMLILNRLRFQHILLLEEYLGFLDDLNGDEQEKIGLYYHIAFNSRFLAACKWQVEIYSEKFQTNLNKLVTLIKEEEWANKRFFGKIVDKELVTAKYVISFVDRNYSADSV